jgi:hypothetical protein
MKGYHKCLPVMVLTFVGMGFAVPYANAGEVAFPQCPQSLPIVQYAKTRVEDGWKLVNNTETRLLEHIGISFDEYPTVQTGFNIPAAEKDLPNGDAVSYYEINSNSVSEYHHYWAICTYFESAVITVQELPDNVKHCEVKYRNDHLAPDRVTIKCFDTPLEIK